MNLRIGLIQVVNPSSHPEPLRLERSSLLNDACDTHPYSLTLVLASLSQTKQFKLERVEVGLDKIYLLECTRLSSVDRFQLGYRLP